MIEANLRRRIGFAVVAIPVLTGVIWWGTWPLAVLLAIAAVLGARELFNLAQRVGATPFVAIGLLLAAALPLALGYAVMRSEFLRWFATQWIYVVIVVMVLILTTAVFTRAPQDRPLAAIATTVFTVIYTSAMPSMLLVIRHARWSEQSWHGAALALFPLVVVWTCDSVAMATGRIVGGGRLAPGISPGKTQAGALGGVIGGAIVGAIYAMVVFRLVDVSMGIGAAALTAAILSGFGQIGDLAESLIKREAGVKDSSQLIPGHGGVLDRLDSLYVAIPLAAVAYRIVGIL